MKKLPTLLSLALLCSASAAQTVTVAGKLEQPFVQPPCGLPFDVYELDSTGVYVSTAGLPVDPFLDLDVQVTGPLLSGTPCNVIDPVGVVPASYVLETCGGGALGCPARVKLHSSGGGLFALFMALDNGLVPLGPVGSFVLDPGGLSTLATGVEMGPTTQLDFVIPLDPSVLLLTFLLQAGRVEPATGVLELSTAGSVWAGTYTTPCHIPTC